jgi:hypothetical protein
MTVFNVATLCKDVNELLARVDAELVEAKRVMGIRPDLAAAHVFIDRAYASLNAASELIIKADSQGIHQPPDVYARVNARHRELNGLLVDMLTCDKIIADRRSGSKTLRPEQVN